MSHFGHGHGHVIGSRPESSRYVAPLWHRCEELEAVVAAGGRGVILFFVGRDDCARFRPAEDIDPAWAGAFRHAVSAGVEPIAWAFRFAPPAIEPLGPLPVGVP